MRQPLQRVGDQDDGLPAQRAADALLKQRAPHVRVHGRQRVVQQVDVGARVHGARDGHALLLAARQRHAAVADLGEVAVGQDLQVGAQLRGRERRLVRVRPQLAAHQHVLLQRVVHDPRRLRHVRHAAVHRHLAGLLADVADERRQHARLAAAHAAHHHGQAAGLGLKGEAADGGLLRALLPGEVAVGDAHAALGHAVHGLGHTGLGALQEAADAAQRDERVDHHGDEHGQEGHGEAQQREQRQRGVGLRVVQLVAGQRVGAEAEHGDRDGAREQHHAKHALPEGGDAQDARLLRTRALHRVRERHLPRVELDHLHAADDLVHVAHALVGPLHDLAPQPAQLARQHAGERHDGEHDAQPHKHGPPHLVPQQHQDGHDVAGRAPHGVDGHGGVLQLLRVVAHQRHNLAGALRLQRAVAQAQALAVDGGHERVAHARAHQVQQVRLVVLADGLDGWRQEQADAVVVERGLILTTKVGDRSTWRELCNHLTLRSQAV
mmetsp:Transcript_31750/g.80968  ORF Transcript_31750/g.80968 Transcript_31750/m.80968 type:complete len:494 (-) Transcript_31750:512-1993(-)